jgi:cytochrome b6
MANILQKVYAWFDERLNLSPLIEFGRQKKVPVHRQTVWYYMGGVALFLFFVQLFTGVLLLFYYQPGADSGYESVRFIMNKVHYGWLFRSIHSWGANLFVFVIFVHMFSTYFVRAYQKPRELTWITGVVLLGLAMFFGFSGYLLPWNELAYFATKVGTDIAGAVPVIGDALRTVLRGGDDVTGATLTRFYAFHVALIPALFMVVLGIHLLFVQRQGMHEPSHFQRQSATAKKTIPFFPNFVLRDALLWLVVANVLLYLAVFAPWEVGEKAEPFASAPEGIRPEWYFMFMFETLKLLPAHILFVEGEVVGVVFFGVAALAWLLVPVWEIRAKPGRSYRPMRVIGIFVLLYIIILTVIGYVL